jgi:peptidoglycan hydrolase-like protein with peptidoglycan-binding domain
MSPQHDPAAPRLRLTFRALAVAALASATAVSGVALAGTGGASPDSERSSSSSSSRKTSSRVLKPGMRGADVKRLQRRLGVRATGYYGKLTKRAVKRFQRRRGLAVDGIAGPATLRALGMRVRASRRSRTRLPAVLRRIAQCESGGNPRAVSADGRYRGKYQFDRATWEAWGGTGDPAKARERVQDRIALKLYRARGTAPWPNCA